MDEDNVFESGYIVLPGTGWRTGGANGNGGGRVSTGGVQQSLSRRQVQQDTTNQDFGFNFRYTPDDRWAFNLDAQYTEATTDNLDFSVMGSTFADTHLDISGNLPIVIPTKPQNTRATWAGPNEMDGLTDAEYFSSNRYTFWRSAMDHIEDSDGAEYAFRGDAQYSFNDDSFLRRFKVGGRYADRDQTVRYTTYNWGRLSEIWAGNAGSAVFFDEYPEGEYATEFFDFPNFFRGATPGPIGGHYFAGDLIGQYENSSAYFQQHRGILPRRARWSGNGSGRGLAAAGAASRYGSPERRSCRPTFRKFPNAPLPVTPCCRSAIPIMPNIPRSAAILAFAMSTPSWNWTVRSLSPQPIRSAAASAFAVACEVRVIDPDG